VTEGEWLACTDPMPMLEQLRGKATDRKLRLFACACIWDYLRFMEANALSVERSLVIYEHFADGSVTREEWWNTTGNNCLFIWKAEANAFQEACSAAETASGVAGWHEVRDNKFNRTQEEEHHKHECRQVRDIFGNTFRNITIDPVWLTSTVTNLAQSAYEERTLPSGELDPARLAVLSDALEETGCDNAYILRHLRGPGPHVRGCWVVDLLLGKD
jgi:hypothetical protein